MSTLFRPFESKDAAQAYERGTAVRSALLGNATTRMLDVARLRPGSLVLDVGTGPGVTAVLAAGRVQPGGHVLAIDASPGMVEQASARARDSSLDNIEVRLMDGARLELDDATLDAVIGRNVMQFLPQWPEPLRGFCRALRPGGRLSFLVWAPKELNRYFDLPIAVAEEERLLRLPSTALRTAFVLSEVDFAYQLESAGFLEARVEDVAGEVRTDNRESLLEYLREGPICRAIVGELKAEEQAGFDGALVRAIERFRENGGYRVESVSRVVSGTR
jgi:SAM-dependent methyltransferase